MLTFAKSTVRRRLRRPGLPLAAIEHRSFFRSPIVLRDVGDGLADLKVNALLPRAVVLQVARILSASTDVTESEDAPRVC